MGWGKFFVLCARLYLDGGCVKSIFTALRAELCFERHMIFAISLREIAKIMCLSK